MSNSSLNLFFAIGGIFGFLAALMAYLITYGEWVHHYSDKKEPRKIALRTAIFTFAFFFLLTLIIGYFFIWLF